MTSWYVVVGSPLFGGTTMQRLATEFDITFGPYFPKVLIKLKAMLLTLKLDLWQLSAVKSYAYFRKVGM